jgi:hypothetical protein
MEPKRIHGDIIIISLLTSIPVMLSSPCDRDKIFLSESKEGSMSDRLVSSPGYEQDDAGCAYLIGNGKMAKNCSLPRRAKSSYCHQHHALCHVACGTSEEANRLREAETLAHAVGGRQGWHGSGPSRPFLERLEFVVRDFF